MPRFSWNVLAVLLLLGGIEPLPAARAQAGASVEDVARQARGSVVVVSVAGRDGQQQGLGTGFIVSGDGLIATNLHVVGEARPISVQLEDGRRLEVKEVHASDRFLDLALLRVETPEALTALELGDSDQIEAGAAVVVLGNPHGLRHSVVGGVLSGKREVEGRQMLQLAVPIEPGNSGGPVLDMQGRVQGIVTMKSAVTENLGFAVEVNALQGLLDKPNPVPMARWLTIGTLDPGRWTVRFGAQWQQQAGRITVAGAGQGFGGRSLCLWNQPDLPEVPFELGAMVQLDDEAGAAGLVFHADGQDKHYGFYPSNGRLRLSRFEGPNVFSWQVLEEISSPHYRPGEWNHLKVRIEQDRILCYVNDQLVIESGDRVFSQGRVGLAKFRDTEAQFKRFRVERQLPPAQPDAELQARLDQWIDQLPPLQSLDPQQLAPPDATPADSAWVLRRRARQLERQAAELQKLAGDVYLQGVTGQIAELLQDQQDGLDLLAAALLISRLDNEEVDVEAYRQQVGRMAEEVRSGLPEQADEAARLEALNQYLFTENGFHGSRTEYYHRANSYLNQTIDDREGLPITLSVLYMELGRRLDLRIEGVGLPGHFVVRHRPRQGDPELIDVFEGGQTLSDQEAEELVQRLSGQTLRPEHLEPASHRQIVLRMLRNLLGSAQRQSDQEAMLRYLEAMLAVDPTLAPERGLRALVRFQTGRRQAALADLDWFLEHQPQGADLEQIRQMRQRFQKAGGG